MLDALTALSPLDGRYAEDLSPLRACFSEQALIQQRLHVELQYLQALLPQLQQPLSPEQLARLATLQSRIDAAEPALIQRVKALELETRHDVKAVEYALAEALDALELGDLRNWLHWGLTSEDVNNLAYGRMLTHSVRDVLLPGLRALLQQLADWIGQTADQPMLARTHGQAASPTTVGKEYAVFGQRLLGEVQHLESLLPLSGKLNGATGNWHLFQTFFTDHDWPAFSAAFITSLGLQPTHLSTQIVSRESYARVLDALNRINQILLDLARDSWQYISLGYFSLRRRSASEVGSSTMPHKVNPVLFENAEGNLEMATALLDLFAAKLLKSRLQRDLSDSTVLRNLGTALGYSLLAWRNLQRGLQQLQPQAERLNAELDQHWEVLAEPLQHALRLQGREVPYDLIRQHTQGLTMGQSDWQALLDQLQLDLPVASPAHYTGLAALLARETQQAMGEYLERGALAL